MERLIAKYSRKLISAGLASDSGVTRPLIGGYDDVLVWNRSSDTIPVLEKVFAGLSINSLTCLRPAEPYGSIIAHLCRTQPEGIRPKDCETRTFLHDLPVVHSFDADNLIRTLGRRKSVIVAPKQIDGSDGRPVILAGGTVSPEQGFVTVSSVCFACFVKFFGDYLDAVQAGAATPEDHEVFKGVAPLLNLLKDAPPKLMAGPFSSSEAVYRGMAQAGRHIVDYGLVDSYFGNIPYCWKNVLYISQTGSSLDELYGCVDPVPLDGSTSAGITASSELSAHLEIVARTGCRAILHGHPKFTVILSMDCSPELKAACDHVDACHINSPRPRWVGKIPIVPGEVGTGPTGLCHTLPGALEKSNAAIVYGHGLFTTAKGDFRQAFKRMMAVEQGCRDLYFDTIRKYTMGKR